MRKSQFSESQIVAILKEGGAGVPVGQILRKHGISRCFSWRLLGVDGIWEDGWVTIPCCHMR